MIRFELTWLTEQGVALTGLRFLGITVLGIALASHADGSTSDEVDFSEQVAPILRRHCYRCHGSTNQEAGLNLSSREALLGVADSEERIVVPGQSESSLLISRITDDEAGELMPPDGAALNESEVATLKRWIEQGAAVPDSEPVEQHWAYVPVRRPEVPAASNATIRNPIDAYVDRRRRKAGLAESPMADAGTLARRVALVLTGLPAEPEQIAALENDPMGTAYAKLVDALLESEAFGQHWTRHWLDLARYADSNGFQADQLRDSWAYRDWVVDAWNQGMPFDQFVIHQLAGDLLPDADLASRTATGFHRTVTCNVEAGVQPEANRVQQVFDRVNTTGTVFLGSTLECAQCHDHKYDPFTQKEYYQLFAFFNNTPIEVKQNSGVQYDFVGPKMSLPLGDPQKSEYAKLNDRIDVLGEKIQQQLASHDIDASIRGAREALKRGRASWVTPTPTFSSNGDETHKILNDGSVLITGNKPGSAIYELELSIDHEPLSAIRLDTMRHEDLPGGGPGRGDAKRTNFVLNEFEVFLVEAGKRTPVPLSNATASFSQKSYDVAHAIDADRSTGWAIAPRFEDAHWAEFRLVEPIELNEGQTLVVSLDQHYGRGRVIGRPKVSVLAGPTETADLTDEIVGLLNKKRLSPKQQAKLRSFFADRDPILKELQRKLQSLETRKERISPPTTLVMVEMDSPRTTHVMQRGDYLAEGEEVGQDTPASLHPMDSDLPRNRLGLAHWLVDDRNPLLARVTVNRLWGQVFGRAIVTTPEDFGTQASPPSHPELLDWLASELVQSGWSVRHVLKLMVHSATFQQSSHSSPRQLETDPDNRWLAHGPRYRLSAESIRDNALAISGLLSTQSGGPPVMPYQPEGLWRAVGRNQPKWAASETSDRYRRGLYVMWKRSAPYPSFVTFDAPDRASCTVSRSRTNTPLQALVLMNDRAYAEAAVGFAQRLLNETSRLSDPQRIAHAYLMATGKHASPDVVGLFIDLLEKESQWLRANPTLVDHRLSILPSAFRDASLDPFDVARWFSVTNVLLNLDETITVN